MTFHPRPFLYATARKLLLLLLAVLAITWFAGCASSEPQKSVQDLFGEALAASRVRHDDPAEQAIRDDETNSAQAEDAGRPLAMMPAERDASGPIVSNTFIDADVREAITSLAIEAGVSVVLDPQVQGITTAMIDQEPFERGLQKLLLPLGFVYAKREDVYVVGIADPNSSLFPQLAVRHEYEPQHVAGAELQKLVSDRLRKFTRVGTQRDTVVIEAPQALATQILHELEQADQAVPQVVLEAIVCVFSPDSQFRFGIDYSQGFHVNGGDFANVALQGLGLSGTLAPGDSDLVRSFRFTSFFLRALAQEGYLGIRAAPRVMAKHGEKAEINIGRQTFFAIQPDTAHLLLRQDIKEVESGIVLDLRPQIRGSQITVQIERAEVSEELRSDMPDSKSRFPIINRRHVSTTVDIKDGETIVIGGLVQRREMKNTSKVPFLGDVPGLGMLFRQIDNQEEEAEVAIFLTARVMGGEG